jgi:hypothetical protein
MGKYTSYKILPEFKLIICNYQGDISVKDVMQLTQTFVGDERFDPEFNVLIDFRNSLAIGFGLDIADYVSFFKKTVTLKGKVMVGILYSTPNQEFLLKIYKGFSKLLNLETEYFKQVEPCLDWMRFSDNEADMVIQTLNSIKTTPNC